MFQTFFLIFLLERFFFGFSKFFVSWVEGAQKASLPRLASPQPSILHRLTCFTLHTPRYEFLWKNLQVFAIFHFDLEFYFSKTHWKEEKKSTRRFQMQAGVSSCPICPMIFPNLKLYIKICPWDWLSRLLGKNLSFWLYCGLPFEDQW